MKRRRVLLVILGCVASITLVIFLWPREREPEYDGVPLSTWIMRYGNIYDTTGESLRANDAIRHIGTNALPFLVRWIQHEPGWKDSIANAWLNQAVSRWPALRGGRSVKWIGWNMTDYRARAASNGFVILGSNAIPVLPDLQRLAENSKAPKTQRRALQCMMLISQRFPDGDFDRGRIF